MTKAQFKKILLNYASMAQKNANKFLSQFNLGLKIDWDYDFDFDDWRDAIGVYVNGSVFEGDIVIGMNINKLYDVCIADIKKWTSTDPYTIISEAIFTNVYHEMAHGLMEKIDDYLQYSEYLDEIYSNNKELFDSVFNDEEDSVEQFAWDLYDNQIKDNDLYQVIQLSLKFE
jgi:hypothetical protein